MFESTLHLDMLATNADLPYWLHEVYLLSGRIYLAHDRECIDRHLDDMKSEHGSDTEKEEKI